MIKVNDIIEYVGSHSEAMGLYRGNKYRVIRIDEKDKDLPYKVSTSKGDFWVHAKNAKKTCFKAIDIDCRDKAEAHRMVERIIEEYLLEQRDWTEEELVSARELYEKLLAEYVEKGFIPIFYENLGEKKILLRHAKHSFTRVTIGSPCKLIQDIEAVTKGNDIFNPIIGKVCCLCKALDYPIPDFIRKKNC